MNKQYHAELQQHDKWPQLFGRVRGWAAKAGRWLKGASVGRYPSYHTSPFFRAQRRADTTTGPEQLGIATSHACGNTKSCRDMGYSSEGEGGRGRLQIVQEYASGADGKVVVGGAGSVFRELTGLVQLQGLTLQGSNKITDNGIMHIASIKSLRALHLVRPPTPTHTHTAH